MIDRFLLYASYGLPSLVVNVVVIVCILRRRELRQTAFYRIYVFILIVHASLYANTYITTKFREFEFVASFYIGIENTFPLFRVFFLIQFAAWPLKNHTVILLHVNRLTIVWLPLMHQRLWTHRFTAISCIITLISGFLLAIDSFFVSGMYVPNGDFAMQNYMTAAQMPLTMFVVKQGAIFYPSFSALINVLTIGKLMFRRIRQKRKEVHANYELNLLLLSAASFVVQLVTFVVLCNVSFITKSFDEQILYSTLLTDSQYLSEAYLGIIFNARIREGIVRMFWSRGVVEIPTSFIVSPPRSPRMSK